VTTDALGLVAEDLCVRYGGLLAVDGLTIDVPAGRLTGLIGPNGAGKTTTFNALTGLVRPAEGRITLFGHDLAHVPPHGRAQLGLGRTFQRLELFDGLTVEQNVALGREARLAGSNPLKHVLRSGRERELVRGAVADAVELCGIGDLLGARAGALSTGQRRLVELARAVAGEFRILLLDEPSSGLDVAETEQFGAVLRTLVDRGTGILLVEHDMALVMDVCEHIHVIDFGKPIFDGTPAETAASDVVRKAYLGTEALAV
jgi:ABC-type branched-subunit amino acid transport system ATPase component